MKHVHALLALSFSASLLLAACGGGGGGGSSPTPPAQQGGIALVAGALGGMGNIDATGDEARLNGALGLTFDRAGNLYFTNGTQIRRATPDRVVTTLAGHGAGFYVDGPGSQAQLGTRYLATDAAGNVYFTQGAAVRKMTPDGVVSTAFGTRATGTIVDGPLSTASFRALQGIAIDNAGTIYLVDDGYLRRVTTDGQVTTIAGFTGQGGTSQSGLFIGGLALDGAGNVYVSGITRLYEVAPDGTTTVVAGSTTAGSADGPAAQAQFRCIQTVARAPDGTLYAIDFQTGSTAMDGVNVAADPPVPTTICGGAASLRRIAPDGTVSTLVPQAFGYSLGAVAVDASGNVYYGRGAAVISRMLASTGEFFDWVGRDAVLGTTDGTGAAARFWPSQITVDGQGNAFVLDNQNRVLRKVTPDGVTTTVFTMPGSTGTTFSGLAVDAADTAYLTTSEGGANNEVWKVSPQGQASVVAAVPYAQGIAIAPDGTIYVITSRAVQKVTPDGGVSLVAGATDGTAGVVDGTGSAARFWSPQTIFVDGSGNVLVSDNSPDGPVLRKVTPGGTVTTIVARAGVFWHAADAAGNYYGTSFYPTAYRGEVVRQLSPAGTVTDVAGVQGQIGVRLGGLPGTLNTIGDIAVLPPSGDAVTRLLVLSENSVLRITLP